MFASKNTKRYSKANKLFDKLAKLDVATVEGRAERKRLAESYYHKDALPTPGLLYNPKGKRYAK